MDKDLLNQYKYMDTPGVLPDTHDNQQHAMQQQQLNHLFNFLNSD